MGQAVDDIKNPPSPPFRHHGPGLASGDVAENCIALAPEQDILQLDTRVGCVVCLYIGGCCLAGSHCLKFYPLLDGFNSSPGECICHLIVFVLYVPNISSEF